VGWYGHSSQMDSQSRSRGRRLRHLVQVVELLKKVPFFSKIVVVE